MNESECFNKLVDPVPETYIGLEPDGLYKECRQVNYWKPRGPYGMDLYDELKTLLKPIFRLSGREIFKLFLIFIE